MLNQLFDAAEAAKARAYAPYSRFLVGAAILDEAGRIHGGCNIENAAYPQGACAEACAIGQMIMAGGKTIREIAIVGGPMGKPPLACPPCGGCRQRIREFGGLTAKIHLRDGDGRVQSFTLEELLPHSFGPDHLEVQP